MYNAILTSFNTRFLTTKFLVEIFHTGMFCVTFGVVSRWNTIFNNSNFQGVEIYISQLANYAVGAGLEL